MPARPSPAPRMLWRGAISFGLVHVPVALYTATSDHAIDFDWLDKRTLDPVGYRRVNKKTGREVPRGQIVKGIEYEDGRYVVLSEAEIAAAFPATTQTIEIETFVPADSIPFIHLERPYYVAPIHKGARVYALLREALAAAGRVGVARVVLQTRQHLAALVPNGPGLVLNLLRWGDDIRSWKGLPLPPEGAEAAGLTQRELEMAGRLIADMSTDWNADDFRDSFKDDILTLVDRKIAAGETGGVAALEPAPDLQPRDARVLDVAELLQRSLRKGNGAAAKQEKSEKPEKSGKPKRARKPSRSAATSAGTPAAPRKTPRSAARKSTPP